MIVMLTTVALVYSVHKSQWIAKAGAVLFNLGLTHLCFVTIGNLLIYWDCFAQHRITSGDKRFRKLKSGFIKTKAKDRSEGFCKI